MDPLSKAELIKSLNMVQLIQSTANSLSDDQDEEHQFAFRMATLVNSAGTEMIAGAMKYVPSSHGWA